MTLKTLNNNITIVLNVKIVDCLNRILNEFVKIEPQVNLDIKTKIKMIPT